jgi:hypothetical protein
VLDRPVWRITHRQQGRACVDCDVTTAAANTLDNTLQHTPLIRNTHTHTHTGAGAAAAPGFE